MDTSKSVTHVSLCAGYGGIDLGLKRCIPNLRTVCFSEIEAFACELLLARMEAGQLDAAPIWSDLKSFPWESFRGKVDILSSGYPCQPFSNAGKRLGENDPRHLWPYIADGISRMQPAACFFENVEGHISLGLDTVLQQLSGLNYRCTFGLFSANEVGSPQQRKRIFILGVRNGICIGTFNQDMASRQVWPASRGMRQFNWEPPRAFHRNELGDSIDKGHSGAERGCGTEEEGKPSGHASESAWTKSQSKVDRDTHGSSDWMGDAELCESIQSRSDELRMLGNGVVPACAARAFLILSERLSLSNDQNINSNELKTVG